MKRRSAPVAAPWHPCCEPPAQEAAATLNGHLRMGVVLQWAGLLSLLQAAGWRLLERAHSGEVDPQGRLRGVALAPGRGGAAAQRILHRRLLELFGDGERRITGRGAAWRAARALAERWDLGIHLDPPDRLIEDLLEECPFLWEAQHEDARRSLAGRLPGTGEVWVAGPGPFRRRVLAAEGGDAAALLASAQAAELWRQAHSGSDRRSLARRGHWRRAAMLAEPGPEDDLARARWAFDAGRFRRALMLCAGRSESEARVLGLLARSQLGEFTAVRRALPGFEEMDLDVGQTLEVAETACRAWANAGRARQALPWVERALRRAAGTREAACEAHLIAATAAWDRGDPVALAAALSAVERPVPRRLRWKLEVAQALARDLAGERAAALRHLEAALGRDRRRLRPFEAGRLWNEVGVARVRCGDLPGAERALVHGLRLLAPCDGSGRLTVALHNLAEVRIRRGRPRGVGELLQRITREDRWRGNRRASLHDEVLLVRWDLLQGRLESSLERCQAMLPSVAGAGGAALRQELHVLAARCCGLLGRPGAAAEHLRAAGDPAAGWQDSGWLEAEEWPALLLHCGESRAAARAVLPGGAAGALWRAVLDGEAVPESAWRRASEEIGPYRVARFVVDVMLIAPDWVPRLRRRQAARVLRRRLGLRWAARLDREPRSVWRALEAYLGEEALPAAQLLADAGYPEARVVWVGEETVEVIVDGSGGGGMAACPCGDGILELYHPEPDVTLRALLQVLALRQADQPPPDPLPPADSPRRADDPILGASPALLATLRRADRLAAIAGPVLIEGETGTGKELLARRLHARGPRATGPFLAVNCAGLSDTLLQSELFGHARGAFTGAERDRPGVFEAADGGTVFLDEIGDLSSGAQSAILRVLQEGEVRRLGENRARQIDVRILAATHRSLPEMVAAGTFRADLYYRLAVGRLELPPLRARGDDVILLAEKFLASGPTPVPRLSQDARQCLRVHRWPGNVRELHAVLSQAAVLADGGVLRARDLELPESPARNAGTGAAGGDYHAQIDALRRRLLRDALEACGGRQAEAARHLGLTRQALHYWSRRLGVD